MKNYLFVFSVAVILIACTTKTEKVATSDENEPSIVAQDFKLPNIFNVNNFSITMNEEFTELYTTSTDEHGDMSILWSKKTDDQWSEFVPIPFSQHEFNDIDPFLSRDGEKLYFISNRDNGMFEDDNAIWVSSRNDIGWGDPELLSENINFEGNEGFPSVASNGNIYFPMKIDGNRDIFISKFENGEYKEPINLGEAINSDASDSNPAISEDESILVYYSAKEGGYGESDLYLSKKEDGEWASAINLGESVNSKYVEYCPYITHDNKYLFYTRWNRESNIRFMMQVNLDSLLSTL